MICPFIQRQLQSEIMSNFKTKICSWWVSDDYVILKYKVNFFFWKTLKRCEKDLLDGNYYIVDYVTHFTNSEFVINKFKSLQDIKNYEAEQLRFLIENNKEVKRKRNEIKNMKNEIFKKYG